MNCSRTALHGVWAALAVAACAPDIGSPDLGTSDEALTTDDVDVAPECLGILTYANESSVDELDGVLPRAVAEAIVARRAQAPLASLADLLAVPGVGPARAVTVSAAARAAGLLDEACVGIVENLALSADDEAALLSFVNSATAEELDAEAVSSTVVAALVARRPHTSAAGIAAVPGVGPATFRALRNGAVAAASGGAFEALAAAVNQLGTDATVRTRFDWRAVVSDQDGGGRLTSATCFGIDEELLIPGTTIRPELATGGEVHDAVASAVGWANRNGGLPVDPAAGLADLAERTAGRTFAGCYLRYEPDPWSGINRQVFIDTASSFQVLSELRWSE